MYTVARFNAAPDAREALDSFVGAVNAVEGGEFLSPRANGQGFAASLSAASDWSEHAAAVERLLATHGQSIRALIDAGGTVEVDTAIEPDDAQAEGRLYSDVVLTPKLLGKLSAAGVHAVVSVYSGPQTDHE